MYLDLYGRDIESYSRVFYVLKSDSNFLSKEKPRVEQLILFDAADYVMPIVHLKLI